MAKYKRQKVKHYHRSFYSRETRVKRGIGIVVLVAAVLAAAWFAAPHVLDWATHTWYTVVKDRDLEAESASRAEAAASSAAASSAAASQAASEPEPEKEKPLDGKAITGGSWAELDVTALTDEAAIRAAARQLKQQGADYALVTLKDAAGTVYYASGVANAAQSITESPVNAANIAAILREEGIIPAAQLAAFTDPVSVYTDRSMGVHYDGNSLWLDNVSAAKGGKAWMNPFAASAVQYVGDLIEEVQGMGYEQVVLTGVQFPNIITRKQDFGASGGKSREGRAAPAYRRYRRVADPLCRQRDPVGQLPGRTVHRRHRCPWHHRRVPWHGESAGHQQHRTGRGQPRCTGAGRCRRRCAARCGARRRSIPLKSGFYRKSKN